MSKSITPRQHFETQLASLVENFNRHRAHYLSTDYNEAEVRVEFIDRFFDALGWDVDNHAGLGPREREVVREKSETSGRSDYQFRLNDRVVFIVEAKAPHVPLDRTDVIMQAKKYAWNSKETSIAAITDFEEFRLYDATIRPDPKHPEVGLIFAYKYTDYLKPKTLDDLWLLSKESVAAGSIDQLIKMSNVKQRERIPVDQSFLDDLTGWREKLAKAVFKIEPDIDPADLNSVVQVFLDRLIFIRFAEDHGILPKYGLEEVVRLWEHSGKQRSLVNDLNAVFHEVNDLLNGEIFRFHRCEKTDWDQDAALVARIIKSLYEGPYRFDVIGVELLGSIYERYLGKTIRVTATRAVVEDKPEVRKAGGVYYTPKYIVDYIVDQTVGKLIDGKTPAQIAKLRILDPACGSGSFLLGAYQELIDYHTRWYAEHRRPRQHGAPGQARLMFDDAVEYEAKLPLGEKAAILKNNIYGVDIDPQAVEITMMSLYIKMLEGERGAMMGRGILPPLHDNIKCGNSLIGHDIREQPGITEDDLDRIRPFDWHSQSEGFGDIMQAGGFDVVIGNPPYVRVSNVEETLRPYLYKQYEVTHRFDIYVVFIQKAFASLAKGGLLGFIVPNKFLTADYGSSIRAFLVHNRAVSRIVDFGDSQVFPGATTYTCLFFASKSLQSHVEYVSGRAGRSSIEFDNPAGIITSIQRLSEKPWAFVDERMANLIERFKLYPQLGTLADIAHGLQTGLDDVFLLTEMEELASGEEVLVVSGVEQEPFRLERQIAKPVVKGAVDVRRYFIDNDRRCVFFPYQQVNGKAQLIEEGQFRRLYPLAWNYLARHAKVLRARNQRDWYAFRRRNYDLSEGNPRLLVPSIAPRASFACDIGGRYHFVGSGGGGGGGYGVTLNPEVNLSIYCLLGILNSSLLDWIVKLTNSRFGSGYYSFNRQYIEPLPIRPINFDDPADKERHDRMVQIVERMLDLHMQKQATTSDATRTRIEREINITDEKIDALVYELYGLTDDEIKIVENS